ncbi:MAG: thiamine diphosphokinase [Treponema sp.]|nr:thiamine diphosphokinase [Treponema sp.]
MCDYTKNYSSPSIHIVIFTGGEFPPADTIVKYWQSMPSPDYVIAADSGLVAARTYASFFHFSIDAILGDMDSLEEHSLLDEYSRDIIHTFPVYKDFTDTELALQTAYQKSSDCFITLIGGDGGRLDHLMGIFDLFATSLHPHVWLTKEQALWFITSGDTVTVTHIQDMEPISFARTYGKRSGGVIESDGLEWESALFRKEGMPSISNRIKCNYGTEQNPLHIQVKQGDFIMFLPLTAHVTIQHSKV